MPERTDLADAVALPRLAAEQVVARAGDADILLVTSASPAADRALAEQVARRAVRDTPFNSPAYTATDDADTRVFIAREGGRAIGLAVLRPRARWAWWSWDDWDAERRPATGVAPLVSWTVETIWVHFGCKGRSLAKAILDAAAAEVQQPISSFGWHRPFTPSGEAFVRRWCPEGFWVPE